MRRFAALIVLATLSFTVVSSAAWAEQNPNCPRGTDQVGNKCVRR